MSWGDLVGFVSVGALLALVGRGVARWVFGGWPKPGFKGWRGFFYVTMWCHPILAGAMIGFLSSMPAPVGMGSAASGRVVWYALAGGFSPALYSAVKSLIKQHVARAEIRTGSISPPARGGEEVEEP